LYDVERNDQQAFVNVLHDCRNVLDEKESCEGNFEVSGGPWWQVCGKWKNGHMMFSDFVPKMTTELTGILALILHICLIFNESYQQGL
jgi:hypothetical protein